MMLPKINMTPKIRGSVLPGSFFLASYQQATACTKSAPHSAMRHFFLIIQTILFQFPMENEVGKL